MTRRRMLLIGLLGVAMGLLLFALSLFFLFIPWETPNEVGGVMMPLTMGIPALTLSAMMLLFLWLGDVPHTAIVTANTWLAIGTIAALIIMAGIIRSHTPWATVAVLPIFIDALAFRSAIALRRQHREPHPATSSP